MFIHIYQNLNENVNIMIWLHHDNEKNEMNEMNENNSARMRMEIMRISIIIYDSMMREWIGEL